MTSEPTIILGGGLAGLSAAYHSQKLRKPYILFESEMRPGGLVRSETVKGFTFDYTGHLLHTKQARTRHLILKELGLAKKFIPVKRDSWVYSQGCYTRAPYQANAFGLPPQTVKENVDGFIQAWLKSGRRRVPGGRRVQSTGQKMLSDWALANFGEGIYRNFFKPYNTKLWGIPPEKMTTSWMGRFVPRPDLKRVLEGALVDQGEAMGYNADFIYPRKGGIEIMAAALAKQVAVVCNRRAVKIRLKDRIVEFQNGDKVPFQKLISTMPLPLLVGMIDNKPQAVAAAAGKLRASSVLNINLGFRRNVCNKQWIYVPEEKLPFYRVGFYHNFSRALVPRGGSSMYVEVSYNRQRPVNKATIKARVLTGLRSMGILNKGETPVAEFIADIPHAYVVHDRNRDKSVAVIQKWLAGKGIVSTGRWGNWEYAAMEDAIWQGAAAIGWKEQ